jgi:pyoverdine/dityrosine biosynthesis protein Dit1/AcrR family transcriptional regulator
MSKPVNPSFLESPSFIKYKICQTAIALFEEQGFENTAMSAIATRASLTESELYTYFGNTNDITLFLFQSINTDWNLQVNEITAQKLAARFEQALLLKLDLILPYTDVLCNMIGLLLRNPKIGINAPRTSHIRMQGLQTIQAIIDGASDAQSLKQKVAQLPSLLYLMHWAVLFLHIQTNDKTKTVASIKMMVKMLKQANSLSFFLQFFPLFKDMGSWANSMLDESSTDMAGMDKAILKIIFNNRKTIDAAAVCLDNTCETCFSLHQHKISYFTQQNKPIHFILPAFPAKSPNPNKVLGHLPDLGEEIALRTLEDLCQEIKSIYAPGAFVTICSDGRIFSALVGVTDDAVTAYVKNIKEIIATLHLQHIHIINLEDIMEGHSFEEMREKVLYTYAEPLEELTDKLKHHTAFKNLFNGIHRFITEDRKAITPDISVSKIKEASKAIALKVIQHSNAWTRFLAYVYPDAVRLSIHPYAPHNDKIGIRLTKATDDWLTPWHGVIVLQKDDYLLMKKEEAEKAGARLVYKEGQPYYYTLNTVA